VMGHLGLTPQSIHALGGFKVQGKELDAAKVLADDAVALAEAGCFAIVLECVPDGVARIVTESVSVPTIGIGAGRHCDGQVLVWHDLLGFSGPGRRPKFVREYAHLESDATTSISQFCADVRAGRYPSSVETYHMTDRMSEELNLDDGAAPTRPRELAQ
jgi:3-methyl-2-oxobutanoate hydroxymethyltransferase